MKKTGGEERAPRKKEEREKREKALLLKRENIWKKPESSASFFSPPESQWWCLDENRWRRRVGADSDATQTMRIIWKFLECESVTSEMRGKKKHKPFISGFCTFVGVCVYTTPWSRRRRRGQCAKIVDRSRTMSKSPNNRIFCTLSSSSSSVVALGQWAK